jgi:Asp/Glu/hydantoin racemase
MLIPTFTDLANQELPGVRVLHILDTSLIQNTIAAGQLEKKTIRRLIMQVGNAQEAGADAVLVTCSSIGPAVEIARSMYDIPVLRIDDLMAERAVSSAGRIGIIATVRTTLEPTLALFHRTAQRLGRTPQIVAHLCEGAFEAVQCGDTATHDRLVIEGLVALAAQSDAIVLAQASMARVAKEASSTTNFPPIFTSPALAIEQARTVLHSLNGHR